MSLFPTLTGRPFIKMHGLLNHFIIVDGREIACTPSEDEIVRVCDPAAGVGADELIVIEASERADVFMRIYNLDGLEVEACGNATRCVAWLLFEESGTDRVSIETLAGVLGCEKAGNLLVRVDMGLVRTDWQSIPVEHETDTENTSFNIGSLSNASLLNIGNPHAVFFVENLAAVDVIGDAAAVQESALFPQGVNVGVAQMLAPDTLKLKVYERGAGLTQACGSGACAAAYAARWRGLTNESEIDVQLPGGVVRIEITPDGHAWMTGPVVFSFNGTLSAELLRS